MGRPAGVQRALARDSGGYQRGCVRPLSVAAGKQLSVWFYLSLSGRKNRDNRNRRGGMALPVCGGGSRAQDV